MFDRFTDNAIKAIVVAQEESRRLGHNSLGTECLLLGLISVSGGVAGRALKYHAISLTSARCEVEKIIGRGNAGFAAVDIPFTPRAKRVLESACVYADNLKVRSIHTEHLLLGLLAEDQPNSHGLEITVLAAHGITPDSLQTTVKRLMQDRVYVQKATVPNEPYYVRPSDYKDSYYEVLQVDPHAEFGVILEAYYYLIKKYHAESETRDAEQFRRVHYAWMVLADYSSRALNDMSIDQQAEADDV